MDIPSYVLGLTAGEAKGEGVIILEDGDYIFTDEDNDGNIVVTKGE